MPRKREAGNAALKLMDEHLAGRDWFVGDAISLADICLFAYTHVAGDADFDLQPLSPRLAVDRADEGPAALRRRWTPERPCPNSGRRLTSRAKPAAP